MKILEISNLQKVQESERVKPIIKNIIGGLLIAINDWPNTIMKLEDYELEVQKFIGGEVTKNKLEVCLSQIDFSKNAWYAESLSQLVDVFKFYEQDVSLKEIIMDLGERLKGENLA